MKKTFLFCLLTLMSIASWADESGSCGENVNWHLSDDGVLMISGEGAMSDYSSVDRSPWFVNSSINTVIIESGVTSIGNCGFERCDGLTSVTIPNSVTSIGDDAFAFCSGLTSVTIPTSVTSIGGGAFSDCRGLTSVTIPNSVTSIGRYAFSGCLGLTSVTIPNSVTSIGEGAFYDCLGLTSVTIPTSVTSIGDGAFYETKWFDNQPDGLVYINNSLYKYKGPMPGGTGIVIKEGTTEICGSAFFGCSGLTSVTIPNSVTSIGDYAFAFCRGLTSVTIPTSVTSIGSYAFDRCSGLTNFSVANDNPNYTSENNVLFNKDKSTLIYCMTSFKGKYVIPTSVTSVGNSAFEYCDGLTSVTIPNSVTSIGARAFVACTGLTSVVIPNSVTSIEPQTFEGCHGLTSVTIPTSVTNIGYNAFYICRSLETITIPNSVTSIGARAFVGSTGLTSIIIPNSVTSIGEGAFRDCSGLTSVIIPNSVTSIVGDIFFECIDLTSVTSLATIPQTIDDGSFFNIPSSATLHVPNGCKEAYENSDWKKYFAEIIDDVELKCSTPTITYKNKKLTFACDTEDTEIHWNMSVSGIGANVDLYPLSLTVTAYAAKDGIEYSDPATLTIDLPTIGDIDGDGILSISDITTLIDMYLNK